MGIGKLGKIWIMGSRGRVAREFVKLLEDSGVELLLTDVEDLDVTDSKEVRLYADMNRPDVIINCAGLTDVELCEKEPKQAYKVNALGARNLASAARKVNACLVQMSTDDVFDGKSAGDYNEFDRTDPISVYGKSKLAGEEFVKTMCLKYLIIRSSWVYGEGKNFVTDLLARAGKEKEIEVANTQTASPTSALEVAKCSLRLLEAGVYGTYHVTCTGYCTRYEFARTIVEYAGLPVEIKATFQTEGNRPANTILNDMMLEIDGIERPIDWKEALKTYLDYRKGGTV